MSKWKLNWASIMKYEWELDFISGFDDFVSSKIDVCEFEMGVDWADEAVGFEECDWGEVADWAGKLVVDWALEMHNWSRDLMVGNCFLFEELRFVGLNVEIEVVKWYLRINHTFLDPFIIILLYISMKPNIKIIIPWHWTPSCMRQRKPKELILINLMHTSLHTRIREHPIPLILLSWILTSCVQTRSFHKSHWVILIKFIRGHIWFISRDP